MDQEEGLPAAGFLKSPCSRIARDQIWLVEIEREAAFAILTKAAEPTANGVQAKAAAVDLFESKWRRPSSRSGWPRRVEVDR